MRLALALLLFSLPAFAAKPVARPVRGSLDERLVTQDAAGVLVRFVGVSKAEAQTGLDGVAKQLPGALRIGFLKTQASSLAVIYVVGSAAVTMKRLKDLAAAASRLEGAKAAYAFLHPGPRDPELEIEAYWAFEGGKATAEQRLAFRDDDNFVQWARKRITTAQLDAKKWPTWPLSELTIALGLPGRDFLERPFGLLDLATYGFPRDVGENLVMTVVYLPDATVFEIRQLAEKQSASPSKVVQDTLVAVDTEQKLGAQVPTSGRAPWDEAMPQAEKSPPRELDLFLTRETFNKLNARSDDETLSLSKLVDYAWRQAHPFVDPKKETASRRATAKP